MNIKFSNGVVQEIIAFAAAVIQPQENLQLFTASINIDSAKKSQTNATVASYLENKAKQTRDPLALQ